MVRQLGKVNDESVKFNKEQFGKIFTRKKQLEARLRGIQKTLEGVDSTRLLILQKELLQEYEGDIMVPEIKREPDQIGKQKHSLLSCSDSG